MNIITNLNVLPFTTNMNWRSISLRQETGMRQKNLQKHQTLSRMGKGETNCYGKGGCAEI